MEKYKEIYDVLSEREKEYILAKTKQERERIEKTVRGYANNLPHSVYAELNENCGSGLFEHDFFESDMGRCLAILRQKMKGE